MLRIHASKLGIACGTTVQARGDARGLEVSPGRFPARYVRKIIAVIPDIDPADSVNYFLDNRRSRFVLVKTVLAFRPTSKAVALSFLKTAGRNTLI
jgi:hypothetical protein